MDPATPCPECGHRVGVHGDRGDGTLMCGSDPCWHQWAACPDLLGWATQTEEGAQP